MVTALVVAFFLAHAFVHTAVWVMPQSKEQTAHFNPSHSWALENAHIRTTTAREVSMALAWLTAVAFVLASFLLVAGLSAWSVVAMVAASLGLALKLLWFNPWLTFGVLLDAGIIVSLLAEWPASLY